MEWYEHAAAVFMAGIGFGVLLILAFAGLMLGVEAFMQWISPVKPPRRMEPRCPNCDSVKVFGEPGHRVCTNCGAHQVNVDHL